MRLSVISKTYETVHPQVMRKTRPTRNVSLCVFVVPSTDLTALARIFLLFVYICVCHASVVGVLCMCCRNSLHCTVCCRNLCKNSFNALGANASVYALSMSLIFLSQAHSENLDIKIATESGETFTLQLTLNK